MTFSTPLAADLHALTATLDDRTIDIAATLTSLGDAAAAGIESYLGLNATLTDTETGDGSEVQLSTMPGHDAAIGSSVLLSLAGHGAHLAGLAPAVVLVLYAAAPGAFVDLAADLAWITGQHLTSFHLDEHVNPPNAEPAATSLPAMSMINQAIGELLGRGRTPDAWFVGSLVHGPSRDDQATARHVSPTRHRVIAGGGEGLEDSDTTPTWTALDDHQLTRLLKGSAP